MSNGSGRPREKRLPPDRMSRCRGFHRRLFAPPSRRLPRAPLPAPLARGWPAKTAPKLDDAAEAAIEKLTGRLAPDRRALVVRLAAAWGSRHASKFGAEAAKALAAKVNDPKAAVADRVAGEIVAYCQKKGIELKDLGLEELRRFDKSFANDVFHWLDELHAVDRRSSTGGTARRNVRRELARAEKQVREAEKIMKL